MSDGSRVGDFLQQMRQASLDAIAFAEGMDRETFTSDLRTQRAVIMSLMIVGEAATKLIVEDPTFVDQHPKIPWRDMRGMRNRIAHGYFDVDLDVVWRTVRDELPDLVRRLDKLEG